MILYADTSALIKKYVQESGSDSTLEFFAEFEVIGTVALTQTEMAAAMSKAVRIGWVDGKEMKRSWQDFINHWPAYARVPVTAALIERASSLAWKHSLRAYDSIHLAGALAWHAAAAEETVFACFDNRLIDAAADEGLQTWPQKRRLSTMANEGFIAEVKRAIELYEETNSHVANRTRSMIADLGEVEALSRLMVTPDLQQGFKVLRDSGQLDKTFESVVVRFQHLFSSEVVDAAKWRLKHPYDLL